MSSEAVELFVGQFGGGCFAVQATKPPPWGQLTIDNYFKGVTSALASRYCHFGSLENQYDTENFAAFAGKTAWNEPLFCVFRVQEHQTKHPLTLNRMVGRYAALS